MKDQGDAVGVAFDLCFKALMNGGINRIDLLRLLPIAKQMVAFSGGQQRQTADRLVGISDNAGEQRRKVARHALDGFRRKEIQVVGPERAQGAGCRCHQFNAQIKLSADHRRVKRCHQQVGQG